MERQSEGSKSAYQISKFHSLHLIDINMLDSKREKERARLEELEF